MDALRVMGRSLSAICPWFAVLLSTSKYVSTLCCIGQVAVEGRGAIAPGELCLLQLLWTSDSRIEVSSIVVRNVSSKLIITTL